MPTQSLTSCFLDSTLRLALIPPIRLDLSLVTPLELKMPAVLVVLFGVPLRPLTVPLKVLVTPPTSPPVPLPVPLTLPTEFPTVLPTAPTAPPIAPTAPPTTPPTLPAWLGAVIPIRATIETAANNPMYPWVFLAVIIPHLSG